MAMPVWHQTQAGEQTKCAGKPTIWGTLLLAVGLVAAFVLTRISSAGKPLESIPQEPTGHAQPAKSIERGNPETGGKV